MIAPLKLILALVLCTVTAVTGGSMLAARAEQAAIDRAQQTRNDYVLKTLSDTVEANLTIGLTLDQMAGLQTLIEREKSGMPDILDISIHAPDGALLYGTDQGARGSTVPDAWLRHGTQPGQWCITNAYERICGVQVRDELGQTAGGLVITSPRNTAAYTLEAWLARGLPALTLAALASLLALAGACVIHHGLLRPFRQAEPILRGEDNTVAVPRTPLAQAASDAYGRHQESRRTIEHDLARLKELDDAP